MRHLILLIILFFVLDNNILCKEEIIIKMPIVHEIGLNDCNKSSKSSNIRRDKKDKRKDRTRIVYIAVLPKTKKKCDDIFRKNKTFQERKKIIDDLRRKIMSDKNGIDTEETYIYVELLRRLDGKFALLRLKELLGYIVRKDVSIDSYDVIVVEEKDTRIYRRLNLVYTIMVALENTIDSFPYKYNPYAKEEEKRKVIEDVYRWLNIKSKKEKNNK